MNGERKSSKVKVKLNGEHWNQQRAEREKSVSQPIRWNTVAKQTPVTKQAREGDAWSRLAQLRSKAEIDTPEPWMDQILPAEENRDTIGGPRSRARLVVPDWVHSQGWVKTLLTTGGAVAIGLFFGFVVLAVFNQEQLNQSYQTVLSDTVNTLTAQSSEVKTPSTAKEGENKPVSGQIQASVAAVKVNLPEERLFVAQAGAFQLEVPREAAVAPLKDAGFPHLLYKESGKQFLIAAGTPDRNAVLGFASSLKQKGIDVYVKEMTIPGLNKEIAVNGGAAGEKAPDLNSFLQNGWKITKALSLQSGMVASSGQPSVSKVSDADLKEQHRRFLEESRTLQTPEKWQPLFTGMMNGINQGMAAHDKMQESMAGQKQNSAESYAWQVQAGVLQFWESYSDWVAQIENEG
ncbi:hypothetical protein NDK47_18515 [Brevibacillus ruminantium]|uniref:SPOR domain-containing protein n=1 Tax=Brevibacillus ruminantium TaxID=2950604 RepID=A0ABY4WBM2_9BACL|nr:hypothetical protein [Brevibacillus ruminantium]USG64139.1 hypothetical protein NDK47_18515 [Brevibacillus ruminantium]